MTRHQHIHYSEQQGCPNCTAIWGIGSDEWTAQQCGSCGWPNVQDDSDQEGYDREFDDDIYD